MRLPTILLVLFTTTSLGACGGVDGVDVTLPFVGKITSEAKSRRDKKWVRGAPYCSPPKSKDCRHQLRSEQTANSQSWPSDPDQQAKSDAKNSGPLERSKNIARMAIGRESGILAMASKTLTKKSIGPNAKKAYFRMG